MKEVNKNRKIELRSEEIEELLGRPPSGIVRWGITIFFGIIVIAFVFCSYFKYPQIITAPIVITTENPATWVVAKDNGKLDSILVRNNDIVYAGQILAAISNPCRLADAIRLKDYLYAIRSSIYTLNIDSIQYRNVNLELGELQTDYVQLNKLLSEYELFHNERFHEVSYKNMLKEKREQEIYLENLRNQKTLCLQNVQIITNKVRRDSIFFSQKIIQISDYENTKQQLIYGNMESSKVDLAINATSLNIIQLDNRINEVQADYNNRLNAYRNNIASVYEQLLAKLAIWENHYVFRAPTNGVVSFAGIWSQNQQVNVGDKVFAIISGAPGRIMGKCSVPISGIGKVSNSHSVVIKLDSYPFLEFGVLNGKISGISKLPLNISTQKEELRFVMTEIFLEQPLVTSYNKPINFEGELTGVAEIITEDMTLIQHFISPLKYLWNKQQTNK